MNFGVFICLLLAHFIADYPLQTKRIVEGKENRDLGKRLKVIGIHTGIHLLTSLFLLAYYLPYGMVPTILSVSLLHGLVDFWKGSAVLKNRSKRDSVALFLIDQIIHLFIILAAILVFNPVPRASSPVRLLLDQVVLSFGQSVAGITYAQKILISVMLFVVGIWGVGIFIRILSKKMDWVKSQKDSVTRQGTIEKGPADKTDETDGGGYVIGIIERIFIIASVVLSLELVIGFILAAKSVARLKKLDKDSEIEYFIIGNLISFTSAIIIGYAIKLLAAPIV